MEEKSSRKVMTLKEIPLEYKRDFFLELAKSAWVPKMKYHRLGDLNRKLLVLMVLESRKSKIKLSTDSVLGQGLLPVLQTAFFSCYTSHGEEKNLCSSDGGTNPILGPPPYRLHLNLSTSQRPLLLVTSHWSFGFNM